MRNTAVLEQANNRRHAQGNARGMQEVSVLFFGHGNALEHEHNRASRRADIDGFVGRIQDEHRRVQRVRIAVLMEAEDSSHR